MMHQAWVEWVPPLNLINFPRKDIIEMLTHKNVDVAKESKGFNPLVGAKFDGGKPRMDLLDADFLEGVAQVLTFGANKYEAHNWRQGIAVSRLVAAAYRHLGAINRGEDIDPESGMAHSYHLGCCVMFLSEMIKNYPEMDDRYKGKKKDE